jgi:hypothetical protein
MNLRPDEEVVKTGTFLYDGEVTCDIRIVRSPVCYGSGDYEDPLEIANDHERETFYIEYGSITQGGHYNVGGGAYPTLSKAMNAAEAAPGIGSSVRWHD